MRHVLVQTEPRARVAKAPDPISCADTLIVSWHWPPTQRASCAVLANLLQRARGGVFRAITRRMGNAEKGARLLEPLEVRWRPADDADRGAWTWIASVLAVLGMVRQARRSHQDRPFGRVMAVYPHRFSLLAGWCIARWLGVPLVAYMHDLFAEAYMTQSRLKRAFWSAIDRRVVRDAALVVVPTQEFARHYTRRGVAACHVLPHCTPADVSLSPMPEGDAVLSLVYAGNVYDAHEDAFRALLRAVQGEPALDLVVLTQATRWVSRRESLGAIRAAHAGIVVLGHKTPYPQEIQGCFPSKIVDYLAVGRPILAFAPPGCFVERFIRETGAGIAVTTLERADIRAAVNQLRDPVLRSRLAQAAAQTVQTLRSETHLAALQVRLDALPSQIEIPDRALQGAPAA